MITLEQSSIANMDKAIARLQSVLGKEGGACVRQAATFFVRSARTRTPLGKQKVRDVVPVPTADRRQAPWAIKTYTQRQGLTLVGTRNPSITNPRRQITRRGLAKLSWYWMLSGVSGRTGKGAGTLGGVKAAAVQNVTNESRKTVNPFVELVSRLVYLNKIAPGISATAMSAAARGLQGYIDKTATRRAQAAWR